MSQEAETVEQVCDEMKEVTGTRRFIDSHYCNNCGDPIDGKGSPLEEYSDRVLAAYKREIVDFQRRYDECVRKFNEADLERVRLRDEVAAKDAEIASLKSLIGEMANILKFTSRNYFECKERMCAFCGKKCGRNEATRLINEAREACK